MHVFNALIHELAEHCILVVMGLPMDMGSEKRFKTSC
jgi:hypothetical protein